MTVAKNHGQSKNHGVLHNPHPRQLSPDILEDSMPAKAFAERKEAIMKPFTTIAVIIFSFVGLMHLLRLFFGLEVIINGMKLPVWVTVPGFFLASGFAIMLWRGSQK